MKLRNIRMISAVTLVLLLLAAALPPRPAQAAILRIDPALSALASGNPLASYPIILEAATPLPSTVGRNANLARAQQAATLITTLGGTLRGQLPLIGAAAG